jgi:hypothetical protein
MKKTPQNTENKQGIKHPDREDKPQSKNPFAYFFHENEAVLEDLKKLGIRFCACDVGGDTWPALVLPSNKALAIASDPEGNGPGAIHVFDLE